MPIIRKPKEKKKIKYPPSNNSNSSSDDENSFTDIPLERKRKTQVMLTY
jgi:hypothetical protein